MGTSKALAARPDSMATIGVDDGRLNDVLEAIDTIVLSAEPAGMFVSVLQLWVFLICTRATSTISTLIEREHTIRPGARP